MLMVFAHWPIRTCFVPCIHDFVCRYCCGQVVEPLVCERGCCWGRFLVLSALALVNFCYIFIFYIRTSSFPTTGTAKFQCCRTCFWKILVSNGLRCSYCKWMAFVTGFWLYILFDNTGLVHESGASLCAVPDSQTDCASTELLGITCQSWCSMGCI